jgi:copper chaperone
VGRSGNALRALRARCRDELAALPGVERVDVDLETKLVVVTGTNLDDRALRAAIEEAGYEAA